MCRYTSTKRELRMLAEALGPGPSLDHRQEQTDMECDGQWPTRHCFLLIVRGKAEYKWRQPRRETAPPQNSSRTNRAIGASSQSNNNHKPRVRYRSLVDATSFGRTSLMRGSTPQGVGEKLSSSDFRGAGRTTVPNRETSNGSPKKNPLAGH